MFPYKVKRAIHLLAVNLQLCHSISKTLCIWYGNINPFTISYALRPRLRIRLTLGRHTLPRKPYVFIEKISHLL